MGQLGAVDVGARHGVGRAAGEAVRVVRPVSPRPHLQRPKLVAQLRVVVPVGRAVDVAAVRVVVVGGSVVVALKPRAGRSDASFWASPCWKKRHCSPETKSGMVR